MASPWLSPLGRQRLQTGVSPGEDALRNARLDRRLAGFARRQHGGFRPSSHSLGQPGDDHGRGSAGQEPRAYGSFSDARGLAWAPSGKEIWFTGSNVHLSSNLFAVDLEGHQRLVWAAWRGRAAGYFPRRPGAVHPRKPAARNRRTIPRPHFGNEMSRRTGRWSLVFRPTASGFFSPRKATVGARSIRRTCARPMARPRFA